MHDRQSFSVVVAPEISRRPTSQRPPSSTSSGLPAAEDAVGQDVTVARTMARLLLVLFRPCPSCDGGASSQVLRVSAAIECEVAVEVVHVTHGAHREVDVLSRGFSLASRSAGAEEDDRRARAVAPSVVTEDARCTTRHDVQAIVELIALARVHLIAGQRRGHDLTPSGPNSSCMSEPRLGMTAMNSRPRAGSRRTATPPLGQERLGRPTMATSAASYGTLAPAPRRAELTHRCSPARSELAQLAHRRRLSVS